MNPGRNSCQLIGIGREQGKPALTALKIKIVALLRSFGKTGLLHDSGSNSDIMRVGEDFQKG